MWKSIGQTLEILKEIKEIAPSYKNGKGLSTVNDYNNMSNNKLLILLLNIKNFIDGLEK